MIGDEPDNTNKYPDPQKKLYCKAKAEPACRFYLLCDKIHRDDILAPADARPAPMRERLGWTG